MPNSPDVATDPDASLTSRTSSAFLTGSRNIYSFQAPISMQLDDTTGLVVRNIFLQVGTLGSGMDAAEARLIYENEQGEVQVILPSQTFIASEEDLTGELGGVGTTYGIQWDLRETPLTGSYSILFDASSTSLSLDRVSLDLSSEYRVISKPEPLAVRIRGNEVIVSWFGSRRLQSSKTLQDDWADVDGSEGVNQVTLPLQSGPTFFRLSPIEASNNSN